MKKHLFTLGMTAAVLVSGCDAALNAALTSAIQKQQGQSPAPAASAPANTPASTTPGTPVVGDGVFVAGRKWTYGLVTKAAGTTIGGDIAIEVAELTADKATIKTTATIAGATTSNSTTVDRKANNPWSSLNIGGNSASGGPTASSDETITVAAGTFACTKMTYVSNSAQGNGTVDFWVNKDKGMIKEVVTMKPTVAASLPAGFGGLDLTTTTTIELKSVAP
jgi:hypothetical protein